MKNSQELFEESWDRYVIYIREIREIEDKPTLALLKEAYYGGASERARVYKAQIMMGLTVMQKNEQRDLLCRHIAETKLKFIYGWFAEKQKARGVINDANTH